MMTDFESVEKTLRQLKNKNLALDFNKYRTILLDLEKGYGIEKSYFTTEIQKLLPEVRLNPGLEGQLTELLNKYAASRYEKETFIAECLSYRQKEMETAEFIIYNENLQNNKVIGIETLLFYIYYLGYVAGSPINSFSHDIMRKSY